MITNDIARRSLSMHNRLHNVLGGRVRCRRVRHTCTICSFPRVKNETEGVFRCLKPFYPINWPYFCLNVEICQGNRQTDCFTPCCAARTWGKYDKNWTSIIFLTGDTKNPHCAICTFDKYTRFSQIRSHIAPSRSSQNLLSLIGHCNNTTFTRKMGLLEIRTVRGGTGGQELSCSASASGRISSLFVWFVDIAAPISCSSCFKSSSRFQSASPTSQLKTRRSSEGNFWSSTDKKLPYELDWIPRDFNPLTCDSTKD